jgi:16S rRNA C967 or C1407 C5-methylase (RsmB/RsmF family)/NOL1/NOP2/fmu family ribosome biogenesis protein
MLPSNFALRTQALLGDEFTSLEKALLQESPVSLRINNCKMVASLPYERVPWSQTGYYLPERFSFTFDPAFHAGMYYVQEASSMFLEQAVKACVNTPVKCLDLCAAPGGKSTHLLDILPDGSLMVSNEVIRSRSKTVSDNITKWGNPHTIVTSNDPADFTKLPHFFDIVVADVPCSGEGMFRKNPGSIIEWNVASIALCAARQKRILQDVWHTLKPGGFLIYSTCTYNTEENEENIRYIVEELGAQPLHIPVGNEWGIGEALKYDYPVYRFYPYKVKGEGFFLALLCKTGCDIPESGRKVNRGKRKKHVSVPEDINMWLSNPEAFSIDSKDNRLYAFPKAYIEDYQVINQQLHAVLAGIYLGELKGKDLIPAHSLAMSTEINTKTFEQAELNWEDAIKYLRKESLVVENKKGYILINYKGIPLGFVKQLGSRTNNLYPQEYRIRTGYTPNNPIILKANTLNNLKFH